MKVSVEKTSRYAQYVSEFAMEGLFTLIRHNGSRLGVALRRRIFKTNCMIDSAVVITNRRNFNCGDGCALYHGTYILNSYGHISLGHRSHLGAMCYVNVLYGEVSLGDDVAIGPHTSIISYSNHYRSRTKVTEERIVGNVIIGNNVFIGANCTILPGTEVSDNVVIGAGSVVKGRLEADSIYAGVPCRKIRQGWYS